MATDRFAMGERRAEASPADNKPISLDQLVLTNFRRPVPPSPSPSPSRPSLAGVGKGRGEGQPKILLREQIKQRHSRQLNTLHLDEIRRPEALRRSILPISNRTDQPANLNLPSSYSMAYLDFNLQRPLEKLGTRRAAARYGSHSENRALRGPRAGPLEGSLLKV